MPTTNSKSYREMQQQLLSDDNCSVCYGSGMADLRPTNRVHNLKLLLKRYRSQAELADALQCTPGYISQLINGTRPFTEKTARKFERALKLEHESLDGFVAGPHDPAIVEVFFRERSSAPYENEPKLSKKAARLLESFSRLTPAVQAHVAAIVDSLALPADPKYLEWEAEQREKNHIRDNGEPAKSPKK